MPQSENLDVFVEMTSSSRRLSKSNIDIFNLRNEKLSPRYHSSLGLHLKDKRSAESLLQKTALTPASSMPKSILVKKNVPSAPAAKTIEEKEEKTSDFSLGLEVQFTAFVFLCFVLVIVVPLSMIIIGSIYVTSCPKQVMIPVFLIVCGFSFLASIVLLRKLSRRHDTEFDRTCYKSTFSTSLILQIGWFIAGCIWIYGAYEPDYNSEESPLYCHKTLYLYSFWLLNSVFLTTSISAILFAIFIFFGRETSTDSPTSV